MLAFLEVSISRGDLKDTRWVPTEGENEDSKGSTYRTHLATAFAPDPRTL